MAEREYELLTRPYGELTMNERAEALQLALRFGEEASTSSYRTEVVEIARTLGIENIDPVLDSRDPRVRFFKRGFESGSKARTLKRTRWFSIE